MSVFTGNKKAEAATKRARRTQEKRLRDEELKTAREADAARRAGQGSLRGFLGRVRGARRARSLL